MKRRFRLRRSADFERVRRLGKSYAHPLIVLVALKNDQEQTRLAVAASRHVGKAVARNRAKRRIRAAVLPWLEKLAPGWDLVLIARPPLVEAPFSQIQSAVESLLRRAQVISDDDGSGS